MFVAYTVTFVCLSVAFCFLRAFFSKTKDIPGPSLAKLTHWYEFYYDAILQGQYTFKIQKLHEQYGPIIQINPHEIHIADPDFYPKVYAGSSSRREKTKRFQDMFGMPDSTFTTIGHDLHRMRRNALAPFFSKQKVRSLQPVIEDVVDDLLNRFAEFQRSGDAMTISLAFTALTNDIAETYAFGTNHNRVNALDFDPSFYIAGEAAGKITLVTKQFPWVLKFMQSLPDSIVLKLDPKMGSYVVFQRDVHSQVSRIQEEYAKPTYNPPSRPTIYHEILKSNMPPEEKRPARLCQDGQSTVVAGTVTTALALSVGLFHLVSQPNDLRLLKEELQQAILDPNNMPSVSQLEALPFLTASIKECLRLGNGASTRLPRVDPEQPIVYTDNVMRKGKQYVLPPGTAISMTAYLMHWNASIFPDPMKFQPSRWLSQSNGKGFQGIEKPTNEEPASTSHPLDRYLQPFSAGTRQCIGINLAYAEMYLALAKIFRTYGSEEVRFKGDKGYIQLFDTTYERDVKVIGDALTPIVAAESKGIRVKIM